MYHSKESIKKNGFKKSHTRFSFFIKAKNPLGVEWVLKNKSDLNITLARPEYAPDGAPRADAASCS